MVHLGKNKTKKILPIELSVLTEYSINKILLVWSINKSA